MKKYEVIIEDENAPLLNELLESLSYIKQVKQSDLVSPYSLVSEESLSEDWLSSEDDELQKLYNK